jgi:hypothetical protein
MPGKPIPSWPSEKSFDAMPTLDALLQQTGMKLGRLRLVLRGVSRWKCKDNTVRYDPVGAAAALEDWEGDAANDNDDDGPANDNANSEPLPTDPTLAAMALHQRATLQVLQTMQRTLNAQNDVIKQMAEPLKMGMQLVKESQDVLRGRLGKYDKQWDRMILITEDLQSTQGQREREAERASNRTHMQRQAFETVKQYIPDVLQKFQLAGEAGWALDLLQSIEPVHLEAFVDLGVLPPDKTALAKELIARLKARRQQPANDTEGPNGKKAQEPAATASASAEASASAAEPATAAAGEPERQATPPASEVRNGAAAH